MDSDVLSNRDIGQEHEFLNELVSVSARVLPAVSREPIIVQLEGQTKRIKTESAVPETASSHMFCKALQNFNIMPNSRSIVFRDDSNITKYLTLDNFLRICIGQLGSRSDDKSMRIQRELYVSHILDDRFAKPLVDNLCFFVHGEYDRER